MRFHKRTSRNMHSVLQDLLSSSKQTMMAGIKSLNNISVNYIELNKACTLVNAFWSVN